MGTSLAGVAHRVTFKVYYEDTDCLGIVYYANYLKFMERGRSEFLAAHGSSVAELNRDGFSVLVRSVQITYHRSAGLGDELDVVSSFAMRSRFRGCFHQRVERAGELIVAGDVDVVCLNAAHKLVSFPAALQELGGVVTADAS